MKVRILVQVNDMGDWICQPQDSASSEEDAILDLVGELGGATQMWFLEADIPFAKIPTIRCSVSDTMPDPTGQASRVLDDQGKPHEQ